MKNDNFRFDHLRILACQRFCLFFFSNFKLLFNLKGENSVSSQSDESHFAPVLTPSGFLGYFNLAIVSSFTLNDFDLSFVTSHGSRRT